MTARKVPAPLQTAVLAGALFVYLTAEMFPIGVLTDMTRDLHTTESGGGLMLTVYALVAGAAILPTVALTRHVDRRAVLVGALIVLAVSQAALALAPNLPAALAARAVAAIPHGLLWSTVPIVAVSLAPQDRQGRATAQVFLGGSAALVGGAPLMTGLASWIEWRAAAGVVAVGALALAVLSWVSLPALSPDSRTSQRTPREPSWLPRVVKVCVLTILVVTATYAPYTFFALIAQPYGFRAWSLGGLQIAFGVAGLIAVAMIGKQIDRSLDVAVALTTVGLMVAFGVIALSPPAPVFVVGVILWGAAQACVAPTMQSAALRSGPGARGMASALYVLAFQIGISAGSSLGGVVLDRAGLQWLPVCALLGLMPVVAAPVAQGIRSRPLLQ
ncbi:MFS transporter [Mycolicibacterium obuense]|uniref:Sugar efflux transporter n=1 Tax=Mycolicibacterium obuense TaxID=1807 RepID=A0A0J6VZA0_9MYCO|nr:MFS transporter [Mycolicibacterium obuense]KMO76395.1 Sugar efflux transporter [Mycolicibacterium obuense]